MNRFLERLIAFEPFHGVVTAIAAALALLLFFLLPRGQRRLVRLPLVLLGLNLICVGLVGSIREDVLRGAALFFLLSSVVRSLFLLFFRSIPARYLIRPLPQIFLDVAQAVVYTLVLLIALASAGVEITSIVTGSALVTAAIGISMRDTLGNLFAGVAIQVQEPFGVGDWIAFDEHAHHIGKILEINWRATRVLTLDAVEVTVPNSELAQRPIRNFTRPERFSRRSIYVVAPYDVPPQRVQKIIVEAVADAWGVLASPAPSVVTNAFTERGVEYWVRIFTTDFDFRDRVDGGVRDRIWYALNRHGITIPGPIRQVQLRDVGLDSQTREASARAERRRGALRRIDFLQHLPDEAIERLAASSQKRFYAAGETIVRQGDPGSEFFIIKTGEVVVTVGSKEHPEELARMGRMRFFGEVSCMTGEPRSATVTASEDCEVYVIDRAAFQPILEDAPELAEQISEVLSARLAEIDSRLVRRIDATSDGSPTRQRDLLQRIRSFFSLS
jgi:small-conductance mechanosensitive channel/CRP-like cAMP-binding protein